ncbi:MAG: hypothetical protein CVV33_07275 [Methanomicrobiales archaeon HGW-Methanomicrobiales-4]|nr:MAG: hypothetical protein CVV33_07275 [Methanomicrobiales archaeon HGW-Methanomicrobiales-4]
MKTRHFILGILSTLFLLGFTCAAVSAVIQPVLFFNPDVVESNTGDDDTVLLMMDGAIRGLSGYGVIISIDRPDIAEITGLNLPVWVGLKDVQQINGTTYLVQGTDVSDMQNPGALQIVIADIKIHAKAPGYANIIATPVAIDDDQKGRYNPSYVTGSIVITGAGPVPIIPMSS